MSVDNPWPGVLRRLALLIGAAALLGWLIGDVVLGVLIGSLGYLAWHLYQLARLERWLRSGAVTDPPKARGLWGEVFDGLYRVQRRHRRRRRNLSELLQRFRQSANAMPDATVVLQDHGTMRWWNSAARRLLGLRWPQDEGQRIDNLFRHPRFKAFLEGEDERESISLPSPVSPQLMLELRIIPYGDGERLLLARDITRLYRLERVRRDFVANVSHELRTPLTVVHGYLDMLDPEDHPEWAPALAEMRRQSQRMARLVEGLLTLSRLESRDSLPEEPVEMAPLLASLAREAAALGQGRHAVEVRDEAGCDLLGSPQDLHSAFSNLVANAVRYTPAGGTVRIVFAREDGGGAALSVEDTGPGIPAEHIPRLTERFYRVSASRSRESGGTGLGLSIVKHVLGLHQARLSIDSRVGHGSRFTCHFGPERVRMRHDGPVAARAAP